MACRCHVAYAHAQTIKVLHSIACFARPDLYWSTAAGCINVPRTGEAKTTPLR